MKAWLLFAGAPALLTFSLICMPNFWVFTAVFVDYFTPWVLFNSALFDRYHRFLTDRLPIRAETPILEVHHSKAKFGTVKSLSRDFTVPIIIRGLLQNSTALQHWKTEEFWRLYEKEEVLCGSLFDLIDNCTVGRFLDNFKSRNEIYISGASDIFERHPQLHDMIDSEQLVGLEPGPRMGTQIFMGMPGMGSDIHAAMGINIFRQIAGRKKWWFVPVSQTAYLKPSINSEGFSAHTQTLVGRMGAKASSWLEKLERYTGIVNPGDVLINPPWYWHGVLNLRDEHADGLVIGCPTRYPRADGIVAAFRTNAAFTINAGYSIALKYGAKFLWDSKAKMNMESDVSNNRRSRQKHCKERMLGRT